MLLILIAIVFFALYIWYIKDITTALKQEKEDFENANHIQPSNMKKYQTEANMLFTEKLDNNLTPLELTASFIKDYEKWRSYAWQQQDEKTEEAKWNIGKSYDNLIRKYCGDEKQYQALAYGSDTEKWEDFKVLENTIDGNIAVVKVEYTDPKFDFIQREYEFHYIKESQWVLQEKYYLDSYDNNKRLPYL